MIDPKRSDFLRCFRISDEGGWVCETCDKEPRTQRRGTDAVASVPLLGQTRERSASPSAASTFVQYWKKRSRIASMVMLRP